MSNEHQMAFPLDKAAIRAERRAIQKAERLALGQAEVVTDAVKDLDGNARPWRAETDNGYSRPGTKIEPRLELVHPDPNQPRFEIDELSEEDGAELLALAENLKARAAAGPLWKVFASLPQVRRHPTIPSELMIVVGGRRLAAAKLAGLPRFPALMTDGTPVEIRLTQVVENTHRRDMTPLEIATALQTLIADGLTKKVAASMVNVPGTSVSEYLGMLTLPESIKALYTARVVQAPRSLALLTRKRDEHPDEVDRWCKATISADRALTKVEVAAAVALIGKEPGSAEDTDGGTVHDRSAVSGAGAESGELPAVSPGGGTKPGANAGIGTRSAGSDEADARDAARTSTGPGATLPSSGTGRDSANGAVVHGLLGTVRVEILSHTVRLPGGETRQVSPDQVVMDPAPEVPET